MPYLEGEQMLNLLRDLQSITQEDTAPFKESFQLRRRKKKKQQGSTSYRGLSVYLHSISCNNLTYKGKQSEKEYIYIYVYICIPMYN